MAKAWLSLGANIGKPIAQLEEAVRRLDAHPSIAVSKRSGILTTKPWGYTAQDDFQNMALELETRALPLELLAICQAIELTMGRTRIVVWGPRIIDIDIIAYEHEVITTERLTLPHPFAHERAFVLDPLREIAPELADWLVARRA